MFYVIEIQTTGETGAVLPFTFKDKNQAESKYHQLLSVCATSNVPKHGALLFNDDGFIIKSEVYNHIVEE